MGNGKTGAANVCWDICSIAGKGSGNDDYGLFDPDVGGCLADGIGRYPLADAIARYACHTALGSMKSSSDAKEAVECARAKIADFAKATESSESGAAITVLNKVGDRFEAAWLGDVACYLVRAGNPHLEPITTPHRRGNRLTRHVGSTPFNPDATAFKALSGDRILLCTDGVWDELPEQEILQAVADSETPREACARLVLGRQPNDDATAIAVFID